MNKLIALRVSGEERELWYSAAAVYQVSVSEFIRYATAKKALRTIRAQKRAEQAATS